MFLMIELRKFDVEEFIAFFLMKKKRPCVIQNQLHCAVVQHPHRYALSYDSFRLPRSLVNEHLIRPTNFDRGLSKDGFDEPVIACKHHNKKDVV